MTSEKAIFQYNDRRYYFSDIVDSIKETNINCGDVVFVHSDLGKFGRLADIKNRTEFNLSFLNACLEAVGQTGTLIVPTFTYSFCKGEIFDYYNSPSTLNYFTELARTTEGFVRSEEPIFSVSSKGSLTSEIINSISTSCFGKDSIFERLHKRNAHILFLGFYFLPTFLHYVEAFYKVPYRYDKIFKGIIKKGEYQYECAFTYNVRDLNINAQVFVDNIERRAIESGIIHKTKLGSGTVMSVKMGDLFKVADEMLTKDPYSLVTIPNSTKKK